MSPGDKRSQPPFTGGDSHGIKAAERYVAECWARLQVAEGVLNARREQLARLEDEANEGCRYMMSDDSYSQWRCGHPHPCPKHDGIEADDDA